MYARCLKGHSSLRPGFACSGTPLGYHIIFRGVVRVACWPCRFFSFTLLKRKRSVDFQRVWDFFSCVPRRLNIVAGLVGSMCQTFGLVNLRACFLFSRQGGRFGSDPWEARFGSGETSKVRELRRSSCRRRGKCFRRRQFSVVTIVSPVLSSTKPCALFIRQGYSNLER